MSKDKKHIVIGVASPIRGSKSTVRKKIIKKFGNDVVILSQDSFYFVRT
jgi:uridine kinase